MNSHVMTVILKEKQDLLPGMADFRDGSKVTLETIWRCCYLGYGGRQACVLHGSLQRLDVPNSRDKQGQTMKVHPSFMNIGTRVQSVGGNSKSPQLLEPSSNHICR